MKYFVSLLLGIIVGICLFAAGFYLNPLAGSSKVSPLAISESNLRNYVYSPVAAEAIAVTNDGESITLPFPDTIDELWEPAIENTRLLVTRLTDSRGEPVGVGIKMSTPADRSRLLTGDLLVDSAWHVYLPGQGTLAVYQEENYWSYLRDIVIPAWRSGSDSWRGTWSRTMTTGPGSLGTGRAVGLGGVFAGAEGEVVEMISARAYSTRQGPVAMNGTLTIKLPERASEAGNP
jgi:hypothetical protein